MLKARHYHNLVVYGVVLILSVPIIATTAYSLSQTWGAHILPSGFTLHWYSMLWQDPRFLAAFGRSLAICVAALLLSAALIIPMVFVVYYYYPRLDGTMSALVLLPFAVPPIVSSVGLLELYSSAPLPLVGTPWILIGTYFTIALPFMYRALSNNIRAINLRDLVDVAHTLGASTFTAFWQVVLPNMRKGILSSLFISFSFLLGEFVLAQILVGTRFETLQVYLYNMRETSGHFTSALVMSYFLVTLLLTWLASRYSR